MAGMDLSPRSVREQIASAIQLIVHQQRLKDGTRRITHVTEVAGMEGDVITLQDLFVFDFSAGMDEDGQVPRAPASRPACGRSSWTSSRSAACTWTPRPSRSSRRAAR